MLEKIPGRVLTKINQKVGVRLLTKFGSKGILNIAKGIPVVGALVGGAFDFAETKIIGNRTYKWLFKNDFSEKVSKKESADYSIAEDIDFTEKTEG